MTMVLDPARPMACNAQLDGSTMAFMSPEILGPPRPSIMESVLTPEADIYAFGMVTFQVFKPDLEYRLSLTLSRSSQVNYPSVVSNYQSWCSVWSRDCAQPNLRTPHPSGFPIDYGVSPNAAGTLIRECDRRFRKLWHTLGKRRPAGVGSCHLVPRPRTSSLTLMIQRRIPWNTVGLRF